MAENTRPHIEYRRKHKDTVTINMPKGERELWKAAAAQANKSLNAMILDAVRTLYVYGYCDVAGQAYPEDGAQRK